MNKTIFQILPAFRLGGAEVMAENLILELHHRGYNVIVISLFRLYTDITERIEKNGIKIIYLDKKNGIDFNIIIKLRKLIKKYNPIVIHTHQYVMEYAILARLFKNVKIVHTVHNIAEKEVGKTRRFLRKILYRFKNIIPVAISPMVQKSLSKEYHISEEKFPIIYNGIDLRKCIAKENYKFHEPIKILSVGRLEEQKNQQNLIYAIKKMDNIDIELEIIGEGSLKEKLERQIKELNIESKVKLLGSKSDVYKYLNEADIFILPSKWEGMPITLIEAMGTGLPIIASNVGGIQDMIIDNISGIICSPEIDSIITAIDRLISLSPEKIKMLGKNGKKESEKFSVRNMTDQYIKLY